jgi:hypothetical protein
MFELADAQRLGLMGVTAKDRERATLEFIARIPPEKRVGPPRTAEIRAGS